MSNRNALALACAIFFAWGLFSSGLGPGLPELAARTGSDLADLGGLFTALFFGAAVTQLIAGSFIDRMGQRPVLVVGLALTAVGILGVVLGHSLAFTFASTVLAGLGAGAVTVTNNLLAARLFPHRSAAALNLANVFFGVGAVCGPLIAGSSLRHFGTALVPLWCSAATMLVLMLPVLRLPDVQLQAVEGAAPSNGSMLLRSGALWLAGVFLLVYVGLEVGVGGWITAYMQQITGGDLATAALTASAFWLALTGGRVIGALAGMRFKPATLLLGCGGVALTGAVLLQFGGNAATINVAVVLLGMAFGPMAPTTVAIVSNAFPRSAGTAASIVIAMGSLGGMTLPWLLLLLLEQTAAWSALLVLAGVAVLLAINVGQRFMGGRPARPVCGDAKALV